MDKNAHRSRHFAERPFSYVFALWVPVVAIALALLNPSFAPAQTQDLTSLLSGLEADGVGTADKLLALDRSFDQSPVYVNALIQVARAIGREGHWTKSIDLLTRAHEAHQSQLQAHSDPTASSRTLLHTIRLAIASAATQAQDHDLVQAQCELVIKDDQAPASHFAAACPILVRSLQSTGKLEEAAQTIHAISSDARAKSIAAMLGDAALSLGALCLEQKNSKAADQAYQSYLTLLPEGPRVADAKLGAAWASALGADVPENAAKRLLAFADAYPEHRDSPHALRAAATCLDQAAMADVADETRQRLLKSYPSSEAAASVLLAYQKTDKAWPATVREAWVAKLSSAKTERGVVTVEQMMIVFAEALGASDDALWQAGVDWLIAADEDGSKTGALLERFVSRSQEPIAEHLAVDLIARSEAPEASQGTSPASSEAACRWAGASERWSMLALAADELGLPSDGSRRSDAIDRLLAESLMQTQRPSDALKWWNWLIDQGKANDFPTLLRGAETAVAHGDIDLAAKRIDAATMAAGKDPFHQSLTKLLAAELSIRRARFDEARDQLNEIIRAADPSITLRPRAQWLVGETYFMQQKYAEAIDAYRRVDSMDSAGEWAPAALLQAGKAFEKLGRGREAAVCYTALLTRFRDWPHSGVAQTRLATLQPSEAAPVLR